MHVHKKLLFPLTFLFLFLLISSIEASTIYITHPTYFPSKSGSYITFDTSLLPLAFNTLYRNTQARWYFNDTWVTTTIDLTITAFHSSNWLNYTVSGSGTQEVYKGSKPNAVYIDGVSKSENDGWTYSSEITTVSTASSSAALYYGTDGDGDGNGGSSSKYSLTVTVVDSDGVRIPNVKVSVRDKYGKTVASKNSDADGVVDFSLSKGSYLVSAESSVGSAEHYVELTKNVDIALTLGAPSGWSFPLDLPSAEEFVEVAKITGSVVFSWVLSNLLSVGLAVIGFVVVWFGNEEDSRVAMAFGIVMISVAVGVFVLGL